jgi:hypothetical protein
MNVLRLDELRREAAWNLYHGALEVYSGGREIFRGLNSGEIAKGKQSGHFTTEIILNKLCQDS